MSLYKRSNVWWVSFTEPGGQRIRRSTGTAEKKKAQEFHDTLKADQWRIHKLGEKRKRKWQDAVVRWLKETEHKADRRKDIAKLKWFDQFLSHYYLDEIDRELIDYIASVKKDEASPSTANRYLALLRALLRMARDEWEWVDKIPKVRLYPEPKKRVRWLTREEAALLLIELPRHLAEMAEFTLATGLRQSNVTYLRWDQLDMVRGMAWIHADQAKSRKALAVPLNQDALRVLKRWQGSHSAYVFTYGGKPVARTSTKAWQAALVRAGIKDFRWHDLRHTWASWHVQNGTSMQALMELGGWSSIEMVLRYAHLAGEHLKQDANRIEGTIRSQSESKTDLKLIVSR